ncbi:MAG: tRNA (adenosine(37)-N6)-threonylcarbamoyltransferase complex ATPase subunit type 1 TsaE [Firmicutes bacterium]|nr:tRNA (adenosine(37)-N6)-threonylcarbamoyltransferase complex ATPase subunit type 1 TsaE [Bacillota bacterium]
MSEKREVVVTRSEAETEAFGRALSEQARPGEVFALDGDLGTGKTVLARGFARGLGISGTIASPTFTMVHEYRSGRLPLYHFDIYRLPDEDALYDIGWDEYLEAGGVSLVEWASQLAGAMPEETVWIRIEKDPSQGPDYRKITVTRPE